MQTYQSRGIGFASILETQPGAVPLGCLFLKTFPQLFLTEPWGPMATLLSVSTIVVVIISLGAPRLPCLDRFEGASAEKRAYFKQKMAVPPTYADLGKSARDVFTKGYGFGLIKLDLKTKSENGLEFTSSGSANTETTKVTGSLETKYRWTEYGLTFTEKWNTDNTLGTEITVEDQLARGLKLTFDSSFSPNTGKKNAKIKTGYKREHINLGCDVDFDIAGPSIRGALVLGYEGWLAGYQMNFETAKSRVTQSNFAVGYKTDEFQLHTNVNDGTEFGGSIYQKVNKKLETAVNLAWTAGNSNTRFGIAAKYQIDPDACFSAKVNNSSLIGLGYTQTLKPGIKLTLSALLDGKNVNAGGKLTLSALLDGKNVNAEEADNNEDPNIEEEDLLTLNSSPSTAKETLDNGDYGEPDYDWTTSPRDDESNEALEENRGYMEIEQFSFWFKAENGVMVFVPKQWNIIV
ncbi:voltage-dependent anion-selective channel protein 1-like protein [Camelus ferus]|nr:voltage-dependent anion-selective channel protein 1-like protein [Camelus ferus]